MDKQLPLYEQPSVEPLRAGLAPPWLQSNLLAGVLFVGFVVWSGFAEIDIAVRGSGKTISSSETKRVQHLEGGIVADILVSEGQQVHAGDILFRIRNESNTATLRENELELSSMQLRILRLTAEVNNKQPNFTAIKDQYTPQAIAQEQQVYASRQNQRQEEMQVLNQQIQQKKRSLTEQASRLQNLQRELTTALKQLAIVQNLVAKGAASTNRMLDVEGRVNSISTDLNSTKSSIPITKAELQEARGRYDETKARQQNELLEELRETRLAVQQLQERLKADQDVVMRTEVLSPVNGILNRLYIHTKGGTIRPGEILADITPADDALIVEAKIHPKDRAHIWQGQQANVNITAFNHLKNSTVPGEVIDISADSLEEEQSNRPYYRVKVALNTRLSNQPQDRIDAAEIMSAIMPGMVTDVHILSGKRTVLDYLLSPVLEAKREAFREL